MAQKQGVGWHLNKANDSPFIHVSPEGRWSSCVQNPVSTKSPSKGGRPLPWTDLIEPWNLVNASLFLGCVVGPEMDCVALTVSDGLIIPNSQ